MSGRNSPKYCSRCKNPMRRLYAKLPKESKGAATMKTVGWLCVEHRHTELDEVLG